MLWPAPPVQNEAMLALPNHVAVLVPSVRKAADFLAGFGFEIGKEEVWEGEGTREIYVEREKANSLLLMEPIKPGAYQRALDKRGPGLHHLAIDVLNIESFVESLAGSGWLLHPTSIQTMKKSQTAYLARPGFPALIEVQQRKELTPRPLFVTGISMPADPKLETLLRPVGLETIVRFSSSPELVLGERTVKIQNLF